MASVWRLACGTQSPLPKEVRKPGFLVLVPLCTCWLVLTHPVHTARSRGSLPTSSGFLWWVQALGLWACYVFVHEGSPFSTGNGKCRPLGMGKKGGGMRGSCAQAMVPGCSPLWSSLTLSPEALPVTSFLSFAQQLLVNLYFKIFISCFYLTYLLFKYLIIKFTFFLFFSFTFYLSLISGNQILVFWLLFSCLRWLPAFEASGFKPPLFPWFSSHLLLFNLHFGVICLLYHFSRKKWPLFILFFF